MFRITNKDTRTTPGVVLVFLLLTLNIFQTYFSVFIVKFEHPISGGGMGEYFKTSFAGFSGRFTMSCSPFHQRYMTFVRLEVFTRYSSP